MGEVHNIKRLCAVDNGKAILQCRTYDAENRRHAQLMLLDAVKGQVIRNVKCKPALGRNFLMTVSSNLRFLVRAIARDDASKAVLFEIRDTETLSVVTTCSMAPGAGEVGLLAATVSDDARFIAYGGDKVFVADTQGGGTRLLWNVTDNIEWEPFGPKQRKLEEIITEWRFGYRDAWRDYEAEAFRPVALFFVPDSILVVITGDGIVRHWDTRTWKCVRNVKLFSKIEFLDRVGRRRSNH